jgi:hypothetical protein
MSTQIHSVIPKLPSVNLEVTKSFYLQLGFRQVGGDYEDYLMLSRDTIELHFFLYRDLNVLENYGMCYIRVSNIDALYSDFESKKHVFYLGKLESKPWRQREFSIKDNDHNLLTFGEHIKD